MFFSFLLFGFWPFRMHCLNKKASISINFCTISALCLFAFWCLLLKNESYYIFFSENMTWFPSSWFLNHFMSRNLNNSLVSTGSSLFWKEDWPRYLWIFLKRLLNRLFRRWIEKIALGFIWALLSSQSNGRSIFWKRKKTKKISFTFLFSKSPNWKTRHFISPLNHLEKNSSQKIQKALFSLPEREEVCVYKIFSKEKYQNFWRTSHFKEQKSLKKTYSWKGEFWVSVLLSDQLEFLERGCTPFSSEILKYWKGDVRMCPAQK